MTFEEVAEKRARTLKRWGMEKKALAVLSAAGLAYDQDIIDYAKKAGRNVTYAMEQGELWVLPRDRFLKELGVVKKIRKFLEYKEPARVFDTLLDDLVNPDLCCVGQQYAKWIKAQEKNQTEVKVA